MILGQDPYHGARKEALGWYAAPLNKIMRNVRGACAASVGCQEEKSNVQPIRGVQRAGCATGGT